MTKAAIIAHTKAIFAKKLSTRMDKTKFINAYLQLVHGISNVDVTKTNIVDHTPQDMKQADTCQETHKHTSEWTIKRMASTERINFMKPFNGDPLKLVRHLQTTLRQHSALPELPLTLVSRRWSIGLTSNFVLTFAGKPTAALVLTHKDTLLEPFPKIFNLI
jgi:hypothetical protein